MIIIIIVIISNFNHNNHINNSQLIVYILQLLVVRPKSRGSVTLRSADPFDAPHLDAGFCSDPNGDDMQTLR